MKKIVVIGIFVFGVIILTSAGLLIVGSHFLGKGHEYIEQYRETREHVAEQYRKEQRDLTNDQRKIKISVAKNVNLDDFSLKKLQRQLKKEKYEKMGNYKDLQKVIAQSAHDLKIWYFAAESEDLELVRACISEYETRRGQFLAAADEAAAKIKEIEKRIAYLDQKSTESSVQADELERRKEKLVEDMTQSLRAFESLEEEHAAGPNFKRPPLEKKMRKIQETLRHQEGEGNQLLSQIQAIENKIAMIRRLRQKEEEDLDYNKKLQSDFLKEAEICASAYGISQKILKNTLEINSLSEEILKLEYSREEKKIEAIF